MKSDFLFGVNVIGNVSSNIGLGVLSRGVVSLLLEKGVPLAIYDQDPGMGRGKHDLSFGRYMVESVDQLTHDVNLLVLPPPMLVQFLLDHGSHLLRPECMNVAYCLWELPALSAAMKGALECCDAIVAPSQYIRYMCETHLSQVMMVSAKVLLTMPDGIQPARRSFGLPEDKIIFICSFEPHSDSTRKNPFAVIDAFRRGLVENRRAHLVIKLNNARTGGRVHPVVDALMERCKGDPRIQLLTDPFDYRQALSLYASCDVFVSLHRSEGLGLGLMESMALGKPVIGTAWSGNMTFMNHANSCLVGYELIPVNSTRNVYTRHKFDARVVWANPSIADAAAWMKKLVDSPGLRAHVGAKAKHDMAQYQQTAKEASFVDELRTIWTNRDFLNSGREPGGSYDMLMEAIKSDKAMARSLARQYSRNGKALLAQGERDKARELFRTGFRLNPGYFKNNARLIRSYVKF